MFETFSPAWLLSVFALSVLLLGVAGWIWYRAPRWLAEQESFTEPQLSESEAKKRAVLGQVFGMPAVVVGVATALVAFFSGVQTYRDSARNASRQDQVQENQQSTTYAQLFRDGVDALRTDLPAQHTAGAFSLHQLLESQQSAAVAGGRIDDVHATLLKSRAETVLRALEADVASRIAPKGSGPCEPESGSGPRTGGRIDSLLDASLSALAVRTAEPDFGVALGCGNFAGAYIPHAMLNQSTLSRSDFSGSEMYAASLHDSFAVNTRFDGANLTDADLSQSKNLKRLSGASFCNARNYVTYDLSQTVRPIATRLGGAQLQSACGEHVSFGGAFMDNSVASSVQFEDADFSGAQMRRADLRDSTLVDVDFRGADLEEAKLTPSGDPPDFDPTRTMLVFRATFEGADLERADLSKAKLYHVTFRDANLVDAKLNGAELFDVSFGGAILVRTDLTGTKLDGPGLEGAVACHVKLDGDPDFTDGKLGCDEADRRLAHPAPPRPGGACRPPADVYVGIDQPCVLQEKVRKCFDGLEDPRKALDFGGDADCDAAFLRSGR